MLSKNQSQCRIKIMQDYSVQILCTRFVIGHKSEMFQNPRSVSVGWRLFWMEVDLVVCKSMENESRS